MEDNFLEDKVISADLEWIVGRLRTKGLVSGKDVEKDNVRNIQETYVFDRFLSEVYSAICWGKRIPTKNGDSIFSKREDTCIVIAHIRDSLHKKNDIKVGNLKRSCRSAVPSTKLFTGVFVPSKANPQQYSSNWSASNAEPLTRSFDSIVDAALYVSECQHLTETRWFEGLRKIQSDIDYRSISDLKTGRTLSDVYKEIDLTYGVLLNKYNLTTFITKLKDLYELKYKYLESIFRYTKLLVYLKPDHWTDYDIRDSCRIIADKIVKEIKAFKEVVNDLNGQITKLVNDTNEKLVINGEDFHQLSDGEKIVTNPEIRSTTVPGYDFSTTTVNQPTENDSLSDREKKKQEEFVTLRDEFDAIMNRCDDRIAFQEQIVSTYGNMGSNYRQIMSNFNSMVLFSPVAKDMRAIINEVCDKNHFSTTALNYQAIEANGLTKFEMLLLEKLQEKLFDETISDELKAEIRCYIDKIHQVEDALARKGSIEDTNGDVRVKCYIGTLLPDYLGIGSRLLFEQQPVTK